LGWLESIIRWVYSQIGLGWVVKSWSISEPAAQERIHVGRWAYVLLFGSVKVERRRLAGQSRRGLGDDRPRVGDVVVAGVDRADGEANDIVVVDDGRHHVQLAGQVDHTQQHLRHRVARLQPTDNTTSISGSGGARISTQLGHCQITKVARQVVRWKLERPKGLKLNCQVQLLSDSQVSRQVICFSTRSFDLA